MSMDSDVRRMIAEAVAEAKAEMREQFRDMIWNLVQFGPISLSSSSGEDDKVEGFSKDGEDDKAYDYQVKRMQHFGFRSRPPKDVWAIRIGIGGGSTNNATVAEESDQYGPSDLEDGEVTLYNKVTGAVIKIDANGAVSITTAAGQVLALNGSTYALPQWDAFLVPFKAFITSLKSATTVANVALAATTLDTAMSAGSDFKSTKAKNG